MTNYQDSIVMRLEEEWTSPRILRLGVVAMTDEILVCSFVQESIGKCPAIRKRVASLTRMHESFVFKKEKSLC